MPNTRVIKPKTTDLKSKVVVLDAKKCQENDKKKTLEIPPVRRTTSKKRASSCTRCHATGHGNSDSNRYPKPDGRVLKSERKEKPCVSSSKTPGPKNAPTNVKTDQRVIHEIQSHRAFTVIAPNPKKRSEIQQKAEEELTALEDLRLSLAMGYISLAPSSVGGCLTLEEVRTKQQQELQTRRRPRQSCPGHMS